MSGPNLFPSPLSKKAINRIPSASNLQKKQIDPVNQDVSSHDDSQLPRKSSCLVNNSNSSLTFESATPKNEDRRDKLTRAANFIRVSQSQSINLDSNLSCPETGEKVNKPKFPMKIYSESSVYAQINENNFKRILILGSPGSGKSTLATKIADKVNLPLFRMDDLYWHPSWVPTEPTLFIELLSNIVKNEQWVIEGNYAQFLDVRLARAQFVIYVDTPTPICLWRAFKRSFFRLLGYNKDLPKRINQTNSHTFRFKNKYELFKNIITFKKNIKPLVIRKIEDKLIPIAILTMENKNYHIFQNFIGFVLKPIMYIKDCFRKNIRP